MILACGYCDERQAFDLLKNRKAFLLQEERHFSVLKTESAISFLSEWLIQQTFA